MARGPPVGTIRRMYDHVLVAVDDSTASPDAVALARRLTAPGGDVTLEPLPRDAAGLAGLVTSSGADLLVLGSSGPDARPGQTALDDRIRAALHGVPSALAVAPVGYAAAGPISRVGVGFQSTPVGQGAVRCARVVAEAVGATLHGVSVVSSPPAVWMGQPLAGSAALQDVCADELRTARHGLEAAGVVPHAVAGLPGEELIRFAEHVDLLVLGSRGYGPTRRLLFGRTSDRVLAGHPTCPVLVVPLVHAVSAHGSADGRLAAF